MRTFLIALSIGAVAATAGAQAPDLRALEVVKMDCASSLGRHEVTLFGNGTVRLREDRASAGPTLLLGELGADERDSFVQRLEEIDLGEVESPRSAVDGSWIERCTVHLELAGRPARTLVFARVDSLPLGLHRLAQIAEELSLLARRRAGAPPLPRGYRPKRGECLRRRDGVVFEIIGPTVDTKGMELQGVIVPLTVYAWTERLAEEFDGPVPCR